MKTSVAIATYNGQEFIKDQLISIFNQKITPDEIIISDDCSDDGTIQTIKSLVENSKIHVKVLKNTRRLGYALNFSRALTECSKDVIFLCDQDDYWYKNKVQYIVNYFKRNPDVKIITHDSQYANENLVSNGYTNIDIYKRKKKNVNNIMIGCCTAFKSEISPIVLPIPDNISHDVWIHTVGEMLRVKAVIEDVLLLRRRHHKAVTIKLKNKHVSIYQRIRSLSSYYNLENYSLEWKKYKILFNRIENFKPGSYDTVLKELKHLIISYEYRINSIQKSAFISQFFLIKGLFKGVYKPFYGFRSFLKDMLISIIK